MVTKDKQRWTFKVLRIPNPDFFPTTLTCGPMRTFVHGPHVPCTWPMCALSVYDWLRLPTTANQITGLLT